MHHPEHGIVMLWHFLILTKKCQNFAILSNPAECQRKAVLKTVLKTQLFLVVTQSGYAEALAPNNHGHSEDSFSFPVKMWKEECAVKVSKEKVFANGKRPNVHAVALFRKHTDKICSSLFSASSYMCVLHILSQNMYWSGLGALLICNWCISL